MAPSTGTLRALLLALVVTAGAVVPGVVRHHPEEAPVAVARPLATRLAALDTATVAVRRAAFCDAVPAADARAAVADDAPRRSAWVNGDPLGAATGSGTDVAHEFGCSWAAPSGATASAWVFAPPVTVVRAQQLAAAARDTKGCTPLAAAPAYGSPGVALRCATGGTTTLSYQGLFGDAWLVCRLAGSAAPDAADLADRWCASVLLAASAAPAAG